MSKSTENPNKLAFGDMTRADQNRIAGALMRGEKIESVTDGVWKPVMLHWSMAHRVMRIPPVIAPPITEPKPAKDPQRPRPAHKLGLKIGDVVMHVGWQDSPHYKTITIYRAGECGWLQRHIDTPLIKGHRPLFVVVSRAGGEA